MAEVELQEDGQVDSPEPIEEVTPEATDAAPREGAPEVDTPENWWDVSKIKDEGAVKRIKSIQPEFQRMSEKVKELERGNITSQQQMQAIQNDIRRAIADPEVYRQFRRQMGYENEQTPEVKAEKFSLEGAQTIADLERGIGTHIENLNKSWENKLRNELAKQQATFEQRVGMVAEPVARERWETAMSSTEAKYGPEFTARKSEIVSKIVNGPYRALHGQPGMDEKALLEKVFLAEFPNEAMKAMRQKTAVTAEKKKAAVTTRPAGKGGKGVSSNTKGDSATIAWLRENGFSFEDK